MVLSYKKEFSFDQRKIETTKIKKDYPDRLPIICEKSYTQVNAPNISKRKYLVPTDMTIGQFIFSIRPKISITKDQALFLLVDDSFIPSTSSMMLQIYQDYCHADGYLYITYMIESTFG
jgi:GABA(A) receptor-associated protein